MTIKSAFYSWLIILGIFLVLMILTNFSISNFSNEIRIIKMHVEVKE
ncbi:MAG: hypothetical protein K6T87_15925 [Roseiflexus sp.]|nr:hypothetical protein [Roseiflexus sp.]MCL6542044.1 hypothetical protein [Roseiflexus sp.]